MRNLFEKLDPGASLPPELEDKVIAKISWLRQAMKVAKVFTVDKFMAGTHKIESVFSRDKQNGKAKNNGHADDKPNDNEEKNIES